MRRERASSETSAARLTGAGNHESQEPEAVCRVWRRALRELGAVGPDQA